MILIESVLGTGMSRSGAPAWTQPRLIISNSINGSRRKAVSASGPLLVRKWRFLSIAARIFMMETCCAGGMRTGAQSLRGLMCVTSW